MDKKKSPTAIGEALASAGQECASASRNVFICGATMSGKKTLFEAIRELQSGEVSFRLESLEKVPDIALQPIQAAPDMPDQDV